MSTTEEILRHITKGRRVLVRALDQQNRAAMIWRLVERAQMTPDELEYPVGSNRVVHRATGGYAHFVIRDEEVMGMEYHASIGHLTEAMKTRVRL